MKVAVTGWKGYLGGHVVRELTERGHQVEEIMPYVVPNQLDHVEAVVHLAWYSKAGAERCESQINSLLSTCHLFDKLRCHCPRAKIIFPSTASVYGFSDSQRLHFVETDPTNPNCQYTRGKLITEQLIRELWTFQSHVIFRFGSLMGLGMDQTKRDLVVNAFASAAFSQFKIELWDAQCFKPILHVRDAAELIVDAIENDVCGTFNAASECLSAIDLARTCADVAGLPEDRVEIVEGLGTVHRSCRINCDKLQAAFPARQWRRLREAIEEFRGELNVCQWLPLAQS